MIQKILRNFPFLNYVETSLCGCNFLIPFWWFLIITLYYYSCNKSFFPIKKKNLKKKLGNSASLVIITIYIRLSSEKKNHVSGSSLLVYFRDYVQNNIYSNHQPNKTLLASKESSHLRANMWLTTLLAVSSNQDSFLVPSSLPQIKVNYAIANTKTRVYYYYFKLTTVRIKMCKRINKNKNRCHWKSRENYLSLPTSSLCDAAAANANLRFPSRAVNLYNRSRIIKKQPTNLWTM